MGSFAKNETTLAPTIPDMVDSVNWAAGESEARHTDCEHGYTDSRFSNSYAYVYQS